MWKFLFSGVPVSCIIPSSPTRATRHCDKVCHVTCGSHIRHSLCGDTVVVSHTRLFLIFPTINGEWKVRAESQTTFPGQRDNTIYCLWVRCSSNDPDAVKTHCISVTWSHVSSWRRLFPQFSMAAILKTVSLMCNSNYSRECYHSNWIQVFHIRII